MYFFILFTFWVTCFDLDVHINTKEEQYQKFEKDLKEQNQNLKVFYASQQNNDSVLLKRYIEHFDKYIHKMVQDLVDIMDDLLSAYKERSVVIENTYQNVQDQFKSLDKSLRDQVEKTMKQLESLTQSIQFYLNETIALDKKKMRIMKYFNEKPVNYKTVLEAFNQKVF